MDAKICDKCKKIIKNKSDVYSITIKTYNKNGVVIGKQYADLCGNCHIKFTGFLKEE